MQTPAGLVSVDGVGLANGVAQLKPRVSEYAAHPHDRRVDRADRDRAAEDLAHDVGDLAAREPVDAGEHRDVRFQPGPERRAADAVGQLRECALAAAWASKAPQQVLEDQRADWRQLPLLMGDRFAQTLLAAVETVPATAAPGQMLQALIDALWRSHLPRLALMAGLAARLAQRRLRALARQRASLLTRQRRITRRRQRAVRRVALEQPLVLVNALTQLGDLRQQPQHQLHRRLAPGPRHLLGFLDPHNCRIPCTEKDSSRSPRPRLNAYAATSALARPPVRFVPGTR